MNIFVLDRNPEIAARFHCDKHVVKMILESAQLLSTAHHVLGGNGAVYKKTHENHPCALWVREGADNYYWLFSLMLFLGQEYTFRFGKVHKTISDHLKTLSELPFSWQLPVGRRKDFVLAMPDDCKIEDDPVASYRKYYIEHKSNLLNYTKREKPEWIQRNEDMTVYI